jgi:sugar phosphate isomerase/epimerase
MKLGCNTLYPQGRLTDAATQFGVDAHAESLRIIRDAGFDGCEFSHYQHLDDAQLESVRAICAELGLTAWSAHSWVQLPGSTAQVDSVLPHLVSSVEGAGRLGVSVVVLHAGRPAEDPTGVGRREALGCALRGVVPTAVDKGITLAVENCSNREDLAFLIDVVDSLKLPNVGFNIDTGHAQIHGITAPAAIRMMGHRLVTTHLQDNFGERDDHLPPGKGTIDWPEVWKALCDVKYGGMLMVEISDCPPGREPDARADTQAAYTYLKELIA